MITRDILDAYDQFLQQRGLSLEAIIVGGTALNLLGYISRQTRDVDIIAPELSEELKAASSEFADTIPNLWDNWLNNGPSSLVDILPSGWELRLQDSYHGTAIQLKTLGRADLLKTKLFAYCDRGTDLLDCIAMNPTPAELDEAETWVVLQDANPLWPDHVRASFAILAQRLQG